MAPVQVDALIKALREAKQKAYDDMVNGYAPQPPETVDSVVQVLRDVFTEEFGALHERLYDEVLNFYPED